MPRDSSTDAQEAGRRATADANHRGGGEGGTADLHAGAADGDAPMRRAQPSGDGAPATGDTGGQVLPAPHSGAAVQQLASGGDQAAQYAPEHMLLAYTAWHAAHAQQQQQQQGRGGAWNEAAPRPVMSAAQNFNGFPPVRAAGGGPLHISSS